MAEAIFGLVGVVVGALVTGGADYVLQKRREQRELRQARRLIHLEVSEFELDAGIYADRIDSGDTSPPPLEGPGAFFRRDAWNRFADVLATHLDDHTWDLLSVFYLFIEEFEAGIRRGPGDLDQDDANRLRRIEVYAQEIQRALGGEPRRWRPTESPSRPDGGAAATGSPPSDE